MAILTVLQLLNQNKRMKQQHSNSLISYLLIIVVTTAF